MSESLNATPTTSGNFDAQRVGFSIVSVPSPSETSGAGGMQPSMPLQSRTFGSFSIEAIRSLSPDQEQIIMQSLLQENQQLKEVILDSNEVNRKQYSMMMEWKDDREKQVEETRKRAQQAKTIIKELTAERDSLRTRNVELEEQLTTTKSLDSVEYPPVSSDEIQPSFVNKSQLGEDLSRVQMELELARSRVSELEVQLDTALQGRVAADQRCSETEEVLHREKAQRIHVEEENASLKTLKQQLMEEVERLKTDLEAGVESFALVTEENIGQNEAEEPGTAAVADDAAATAGESAAAHPPPGLPPQLDEDGQIAHLKEKLSELEEKLRISHLEKQALSARHASTNESCDSLRNELMRVRLEKLQLEDRLKEVKTFPAREPIAVRMETNESQEACHTEAEEQFRTQETDLLMENERMKAKVVQLEKDEVVQAAVLKESQGNFERVVAEYEKLIDEFQRFKDSDRKSKELKDLQREYHALKTECARLTDSLTNALSQGGLERERRQEAERRVHQLQQQMQDQKEQIGVIEVYKQQAEVFRSDYEQERRHSDQLKQRLQQLDGPRAGERRSKPDSTRAERVPSDKKTSFTCPICEGQFHNEEEVSTHVDSCLEGIA